MNQMDQIISGLFEKTVNGKIFWDDSVETGKYQTRMGDFAIEIAGGNKGLLKNTTLTILKLDGKLVDRVHTNDIFVSNIEKKILNSNGVFLTDESKAVLMKLFLFLDKKNTDLDDLVNLLK